ncbi:hypothetical protein BpHYR1_002231 [Brachionus plicatilis]|uniref:Uncharacterized protein n=1 Tax=Brachionus plicatilis TaxID=10195 RepID=A0A3M7SEV7_BRAPC|nr:hypothetical protein BpHYR1_002231 [Brachionus plicatilis]
MIKTQTFSWGYFKNSKRKVCYLDFEKSEKIFLSVQNSDLGVLLNIKNKINIICERKAGENRRMIILNESIKKD